MPSTWTSAYAFINYLLDPQVMANNSNFISYPNAVPKSKALMEKSITDDPTIYPPPEVAAKLFTFAHHPAGSGQAVHPDLDRAEDRASKPANGAAAMPAPIRLREVPAINATRNPGPAQHSMHGLGVIWRRNS